jgi:hypothetical protein
VSSHWKSHERIGIARHATKIAGRGIPGADDVIDLRAQSRAQTSVRQTLQEAKPKAGSIFRLVRAARCGSQMGVKAQKSNATIHPRLAALSTFRYGRWVTPTKINRGGCAACEATRGPERQRWRSSLIRGNKPAKGGWKTQEHRRARVRRKEDLIPVRPARPRKSARVAEHRADRDRDGA